MRKEPQGIRGVPAEARLERRRRSNQREVMEERDQSRGLSSKVLVFGDPSRTRDRPRRLNDVKTNERVDWSLLTTTGLRLRREKGSAFCAGELSEEAGPGQNGGQTNKFISTPNHLPLVPSSQRLQFLISFSPDLWKH